MEINRDRIIVAVSIVFAAAYLYATGQITMLDFGDPIGPRLFPYVVCSLFVLGALILLLESRSSRRTTADDPIADAPRQSKNAQQRRSLWMIAAVLGWTLLYLLVFERLGYIISTVTFLLGLTLYFYRGRWQISLAVSALVPVLGYLVFHHLLNVNLPAGLMPL